MLLSVSFGNEADDLVDLVSGITVERVEITGDLLSEGHQR